MMLLNDIKSAVKPNVPNDRNISIASSTRYIRPQVVIAWFTSVNVRSWVDPTPRHARSTRSTCFRLSSVVAAYFDRLRGFGRLLPLLPTGASSPLVREFRNEDGDNDDNGDDGDDDDDDDDDEEEGAT